MFDYIYIWNVVSQEEEFGLMLEEVMSKFEGVVPIEFGNFNQFDRLNFPENSRVLVLFPVQEEQARLKEGFEKRSTDQNLKFVYYGYPVFDIEIIERWYREGKETLVMA